jgi:hypothetical protein
MVSSCHLQQVSLMMLHWGLAGGLSSLILGNRCRNVTDVAQHQVMAPQEWNCWRGYELGGQPTGEPQ